MVRRVVLALLLACSPALAADWYVTFSTATGKSCATAALACRPSEVWSKVGNNDTVHFAAGTYSNAVSANYMVLPGTQTETGVKLLCDDPGGNGGLGCYLYGAWTANAVVNFANVSSWTLDGFNACCSAWTTSSSNVGVIYSAGSSNQFLRTIAWDGADGGWGNDFPRGSNELRQDYANFGVGRKACNIAADSGNGAIFRRALCLVDGGATTEAVKTAWSPIYRTSGRVAENIVALVTAQQYIDMNSVYWINASIGNDCDGSAGASAGCTLTDPCASSGQPTNIRGVAAADDVAVLNVGGAARGSVFAIDTPIDCTDDDYGVNTGGGSPSLGMGGIDFDNNVAFVTTNASSGAIGFNIPNRESSARGAQPTASNMSSIAPAPDAFGGSVTGTDRQHSDSDTATRDTTCPGCWGLADNIYEGNGAAICHRVVNGVDTGEPLFPLPITWRINALCNAVGGPCFASHTHMLFGGVNSNCTPGTPGTGPDCTPTLHNYPHQLPNLNNWFVKMFGRPPADCRKQWNMG